MNDNLKIEFAFNPYEKVLEDTGRWNWDSRFDGTGYDINYSDILTKLIQETGRLCDRYASDLWLDLKSIEKALTEKGVDQTFIIGIRGNGVDHKTFVESRIRNNRQTWSYQYRAVYILTVKADDDNSDYCTMRLGKCDISVK